MARRADNEKQLHVGPAWFNQGLFSRNFLETRIAAQTYWGCDDRANAILAEISRCYRQDYAPARQEGNEEDTRNAWIDPVLRAMGWDYHRERHIRRGVPDYILFLSQADKRAATKAENYAGYFSRAAGILEAKYWDRPLNNLVPVDAFDPSDATGQLLGYLTLLDVNSDGRCQWAILTNGRQWRLFYNRAKGKATTYYEVDLLEMIHRGDPEQFKYFLCLFEPAAFARDAQTGLTRLDAIVTESQRYAERVSQSLKDAIFDAREGVFIQLARGFVEHRQLQNPEHPFTDAELDAIHHGTLLLLYRLLFLLYAESRDLLPARDERGYGHQSLTRQARRCAEIVDGKYTPPMRSTDIWSDLLTLFEVIRHGDPKLDVPVYNGGLFEPTDLEPARDFFGACAVTDAFLSAGLDRLTRAQDESGNRVWIDYSSLAVQHLGSIYEGLLEFRLRFAPERLVAVEDRGTEVWKPDGALTDEQRRLAREGKLLSVEQGHLYLTNERCERKATGSYYTPDYIVKHIVQQAVGPILKERKAATAKLLQELDEKLKAHARLKAPGSVRMSGIEIERLCDRIFDTLFEIRALDPAMGSGHFLVETVDFLADGIIEFLSSESAGATRRAARTKTNPVLRKIEQQRRVILEGLERQGIELTPEKRAAVEAKLSDNNLIRRMVLKRCIYGVDINPLAVELAKVSLWLHCFTLGAPLSFLDHHLRCGNSLIGVTVGEARAELQQELFGSQFQGLLRATEFMCKVGELTDSTFAEVKQSAESYREAARELGPFKAMLDMWAAHFVNAQSVSGARDVLHRGFTYLDLPSLESKPPSSAAAQREIEILRAVRDLAEQTRFFHWELEFPEVWYQAGTAREDPGFHAVIGNPPWERIKLQEREFFQNRAPEIGAAVSAATRRRLIEQLAAKNPALYGEYTRGQAQADGMSAFLRGCGQYPFAARGDMNTYILFAERAYGKVQSNGRIGLLVPSGIATDNTTAPFFNDLMSNGRLIGLYDFENKMGIFPDVHRSFKFCILILGGAGVRAEAADFVFFAHEMSDLNEKERHIPLSAADMALMNPNTKTCPVFRSLRDAELTKAIYRRVPVLVDESKGEAGNPWGVKFLRMFDQTNDAALFRTAKDMQDMGLVLKGNVWTDTRGKKYVPLYEAKMVQAYDHRAASVVVEDANWVRQGQTSETTLKQHQDRNFQVMPRWWVEEGAVNGLLGERLRPTLFCYKDVTSPTNERTMIAAIVPLAAVVNSAPIVLVDRTIAPALECCLLANLNAFAYDFAARQKVGGVHLNFFIVNQLPTLPPSAYAQQCPWNANALLRDWIADRVLELVYTSEDIRSLALACGCKGAPFVWDEDRRALLRAELDAAFFILYGLSRGEVEYVFSTFTGTQRKDEREHGYYRSAKLTLARYDEMKAAR